MGSFVQVPVPEEHVLAVYELLSRLARESQETRADAGWTENDLRRIRDCQLDSVRKVAAVLDVLSKRPTKAMSYTELNAALGLKPTGLQGALSGFTRWIHREWPDDNDGWPLFVGTGSAGENGSAESESFYFVPELTAERWIRVRSE